MGNFDTCSHYQVDQACPKPRYPLTIKSRFEDQFLNLISTLGFCCQPHSFRHMANKSPFSFQVPTWNRNRRREREKKNGDRSKSCSGPIFQRSKPFPPDYRKKEKNLCRRTNTVVLVNSISIVANQLN